MFYYLDFECNLYIMDHFPGSFSVKRARGAILSGLYPMKLAIFKIPGCLIFKQSFHIDFMIFHFLQLFSSRNCNTNPYRLNLDHHRALANSFFKNCNSNKSRHSDFCYLLFIKQS